MVVLTQKEIDLLKVYEEKLKRLEKMKPSFEREHQISGMRRSIEILRQGKVKEYLGLPANIW